MEKKENNVENILNISKICGKILIKIKGLEEQTGFWNSSKFLKGELSFVLNDYAEETVKEPLFDKRIKRMSIAENSKNIGALTTYRAFNYLCELFKNTKFIQDGKTYTYNYSHVKIGKLLTLSAILYANEPNNIGQRLFEDDIISLSCGCTINYVDFMDIDKTGELESIDTFSVIDKNDIDNSCIIDEKPYRAVLYIFIRFGACSQQDLGKYIDNYKPEGTKEFSRLNVNEFVNLEETSVTELSPFNEYIEQYWEKENARQKSN